MRPPSFGPLEEIELCLSVWWFVHDDLKVVTHWAAKTYALAGDDDTKFADLRAFAETDYASVTWHAVPESVVTILNDGRSVHGAMAFTDAFRNDPDRFAVPLRVIDEGMPTHPFLGMRSKINWPMSLGEPFLSVETIVKYDGSGLIGAVVGTEPAEDDEEGGEIPGGPDEIKTEAFFESGPSMFHGWQEMPRGLTLAFWKDGVEATHGFLAQPKLREAVKAALEAQASKDHVLAALGESETHFFVVLSAADSRKLGKAATALSRFAGYHERGDGYFDPERYRPIVLWDEGWAREFAVDAIFAPWPPEG